MRRRRPGLLSDPEDDDPMSGVANLFDTVMVFAVALLLARVVSYNVPELLQPEADHSQESGRPQYADNNQGREPYPGAQYDGEDCVGGQGTKMGTAYLLEGGQVVYIPENATVRQA